MPSAATTADDASTPVAWEGEMDRQQFRRSISRFASGVTVITTFDRSGAPAGMTASAVTSLSLDPVQLLVCISDGLPTLDSIRASGRFAVNVLAASHADLAMRFADPTADRFAGLGLREGWGSPVLADALAVFDCTVAEFVPGGDHTIVIGDVRACEHDPDGRPLVYWASGFADLSEPAAS